MILSTVFLLLPNRVPKKPAFWERGATGGKVRLYLIKIKLNKKPDCDDKEVVAIIKYILRIILLIIMFLIAFTIKVK